MEKGGFQPPSAIACVAPPHFLPQFLPWALVWPRARHLSCNAGGCAAVFHRSGLLVTRLGQDPVMIFFRAERDSVYQSPFQRICVVI